MKNQSDRPSSLDSQAVTSCISVRSVAIRLCIRLSLAGLALITPLASADVAEVWVRRYSNVVSNSNDQAVKVVRDLADDIIVAGDTADGSLSDMLTIKYSGADGSIVWQRRYNGPKNKQDHVFALAVDRSGNVVVAGVSNNLDEQGTTDADSYLAKYAGSDGALLWEKRFSDPVYHHSNARGVSVDGAGNIIVIGFTRVLGDTNDYYTAKFAAADGTLLWDRRSRHNGAASAVDNDGNAFVTGTVFNGTSFDFYTIKYAAADGAVLWEERYHSPAIGFGKGRAVTVDGFGNAIAAGSISAANGNPDCYTAKYAAANGALLWEKRCTGPSDRANNVEAVSLDDGDNVVITGLSRAIGPDGHVTGPDHYYTAKLAAIDGALVWETDGPTNRNDQATSVAVDGSGNVIVTGISFNGTNSIDHFKHDYYTAKYAASNGALIWERRYDGPANDEDRARAIAVDSSGNLFVTGFSFSPPSSPDDYTRHDDWYTAKYAASDGAILWEKRYNGLANFPDEAQALVLDGDNNVIVTGYSFDRDTSFDYYTAKYAGSSGALLWERRYNGPANRNDQARALVVDCGNNVIVTGQSYNGTNYDYCTVKYAATNGAILWENIYNGPGNQDDQPTALAVDSSGNVFATGYSENASPKLDTDYYTAKYAAADGALLWEHRYNGPAKRDDRANAMAVDGSGNVVVTGFTYTGSNDVFYTAKYAGESGTLLWETRSTNSTQFTDKANAVAVDSGGNVAVAGSVFTTNPTNGPSYSDYYTAKYAAGNGALLWEKRYNGPSNRTDIARALAVDASGNIVVTGFSDNGTFGVNDYYTAKYATADGALLWEKRSSASE